MNENYEQPKKTGTALKVVLITITLISVVTAAAMGLLYYNASTNLELVREKNEALGVDRDKYKALAADYEAKIGEYQEEIADLTEQLAEARSIVEIPTLAGQDDTSATTTPAPTDNNNNQTTTTTPTPTPTPTPTDSDGEEAVVNLTGVTTLDKKPANDKLYEGVTYKVIASGINIRSGPGTNYRQVGSANNGAELTAYSTDGDWLLIKTQQGTFGWVKSNFVEKK